ncbi:MAG: CapA family protein [Eubacteriales bacterium]|nr:CapA family protein [Eubacteriales bacterium]
MGKTLRVAVMGDICMNRIQDEMDEGRAKGLLAEVRPLLARADVRIANLENAITEPLTPIAKCGPNLWQKRENLCFYREAGIDCAILANNHTGDFGPGAVEETVRVLDEEGFGHTGAGENLDAAYEPWYTDTPAGRLAVCAFCENEFGGATLDAWGSAGFDLHRVSCALRKARENADFVLAVMHGGNEYNPLPSPGVRARYRTFVDLGADAVVGMHPHCMQGAETYRGAPVIYSPGNFLFHSAENDPSWYSGYIVELTFEKGEKPAFLLHPYRFNPELTRIHLYEGEEKQAVLEYLERLSAIIGDERLLRQYFDGWCMITGPAHARPSFDDAYLEEQDFPKGHMMLAVRNIRTCEAHNELVTNLCRVIVEGRVGAAREMVPKIRELQKMPV